MGGDLRHGGGPDGGADPAGPRAVCQGRGRLYPILLHCAPAAGPGAGGAAHRVSFYRPLGRQYLRLRCASYNSPAQHFYQRYGFYKIGEEQGSRVPLDILEKYIGYDR
mgnify:CR=1 FL=1